MKNKKLLIGCGAAAGVVILFALIMYFWISGTYNSMVTLNLDVQNAWSQVENQYQRRYDLIPNLVNTVKGVANFEKETYTAVTEARSRVGQINVTPELINNPAALQQFQLAQDNLGGALSRLLVTVEKYPELKANENFLQLQAQLEGTENRIAVERRNFNNKVTEYNKTISVFPGKILADFFGFTIKENFKAVEGAETAPKVEF